MQRVELFPRPNVGPIARGVDAEKPHLIAASLHHAVAEGFISISKLGLYDWMFG